MKKCLNRFGFIFQVLCTSFLPVYSQTPPEDYFQQEVNFIITVSLDVRLHELSAFETIQYINNSPDTLKILYFHLWPNAYSGNNTALAKQLKKNYGRQKLFNDPDLKGYIDSLDFRIDSEKVKWNYLPEKPDICIITLNVPAKPGDTLIITTPFHVRIPKGVTSRLGQLGGSYQISQWFPKPAVYDRSGWNQMVYLDQGEFYSEFGKFEVSVTLPSDYIVAATGRMINEEETGLLQPGVYSDRMKTWMFVQENIHDFAWFADKRFIVKRGSVILPGTGRKIETATMFTADQAFLWQNSLQYVNDALLYYSNLLGEYPYDTFTAVEGALEAGSGMEYPCITVIGPAKDEYDLDDVIAHEICHSWFYGAIGNNERKYPFMDEGITTAYEKRYMQRKYPSKKAWESFFKNKKIARFFKVDELPASKLDELEWLIAARKNLDQPVNLPADVYSESQYARIVYGKAGMGFDYLRNFLGDSLFDSVMHDYYQKWKFRHPQPDDLREVFESGTGKDVSWFFDDFLGTSEYVDYKIAGFRDDQLLIKNKGRLASPVLIAGMREDSVVYEKWYGGFKGQTRIGISADNFSGYKIDPLHKMPELYRLNNNYSLSLAFPKSDPVLTQFYFTIGDPEKLSLMFIPLPNWSREDGFMAGLAVHNGFILPQHIEYYFVPFYSFGMKKIEGYSRVAYNVTPQNSFIRLAKISAEGSKFAAPGFQEYQKIRFGSSFYFRKSFPGNPLEHSVHTYITGASDPLRIMQFQKARLRPYFQLSYEIERTGRNDPFDINLSVESGSTFNKASGEINYRYKYYRKNNGMDIRFFTGLMLKSDPARPFYSLAASGRSGREQYLFAGIFPDRFALQGQNFWSRQMTLSEGGIISPVNDTIGFSRWLISFSLTSSIPVLSEIIPVKPFLNMVLCDHGGGPNHKPEFFYETGLKTGIRDLLDIYIPLIVAPNIRTWSGPLRARIRFVLTFDIPISISVD